MSKKRKDERRQLSLEPIFVQACQVYADRLGLKWQDAARVLLTRGLRQEGIIE